MRLNGVSLELSYLGVTIPVPLTVSWLLMGGSPQVPKRRILSDRYELHEIAGKGGMGVVWRAWDLSVQREVAIKLVLPAHTEQEQDQRLARIRRERDVLIDLSQHPNIVTLFDVLTDPLGYVMEWLPGFNLEQWLTINQGPQSFETVAAVFGPVLDAVGYAHERGVVHRDIKSSNIFLQVLGDRATVRVMDYGLARIVEQESNITTGRLIVGTPQYMAPEQVLGTECTAATDIYSLGILLFECVTGQLPIEAKGDSPIPMLVSKVNEELPRASTVLPSIPPALDDVIAKATSRIPDARFASCEEFAEALFAALPDLSRRSRSSIDVEQLGFLPTMAGEFQREETPPNGFEHTVPVDRELFGEPPLGDDDRATMETLIDGAKAEILKQQSADTKAMAKAKVRDEDQDDGRPLLSEDTRNAIRTIQRNAIHSAKRSTTSVVERLQPQRIYDSYLALPSEKKAMISIVGGISIGLILVIIIGTIWHFVDSEPVTNDTVVQLDEDSVFPNTDNLPDDAPLVESATWIIDGENLNSSNVRGALRTYERVIRHWNKERPMHVVASHRSPMRCYYDQANFPREQLPQDSISRAIQGRPTIPITPQRITVTQYGRDFVTFVEEGVSGPYGTPYTRLIQMAGSNRSHWLVSIEVNEGENRCFDKFESQWAIWQKRRAAATPPTPAPVVEPSAGSPSGTIVSPSIPNP